MSNAITIKENEYAAWLEKMCEAVTSIEMDMVRLGRLYVSGITANPEWSQRIRDELPNYGYSFWRLLEDLGTGRILPEFSRLSWVHRHVRKLSETDQRLLLAGSVSVLDPAGESRRIPIGSMTEEQLLQVVGQRHIRNEAEQRTWLERRASRAEKKQAAELAARQFSWRVVKRRHEVQILNRANEVVAVLPARELRQMIEEVNK